MFGEVITEKSEALAAQLTKCPGCGEALSSYDELIDHVVVAHNITCQVCGEKLNSKGDLLAHNKEKHGMGGDAIG
jgi:transcription elongation factor Elf1